VLSPAKLTKRIFVGDNTNNGN